MSMSREQAKALLGENATDEQINALLNKFHEEQKELKDQIATMEKDNSNLKTKNAELQGYKTKIDEIEREKMSEAEKIQLSKEEWAEKNRMADLRLNSIEAKSILIGAGVSDAEAEALVASIVKENKDDTLKAANLLAAQFNSIKENTAKRTKEELSNIDIKPNPSNKVVDSETMTREKFFKLSQSEQNKFVEEHPDEFYKL